MKKLLILPMITILVSVWTLPVLADQLTDVKKQKDSIDGKINNIGQQKQKEQKKLNEVKNEKNNLINQQQQKSKEYKQLKDKEKSISDNIKITSDTIEECEEKYNQQKTQLKTRIKAMYESSSTAYIDTLLESENLLDFFERVNLISILSKKDKQLMEQINNTNQDLEFKKQRAEQAKRDLQKQEKEKLETINNLQVSRAAADEKEKKIKQKLTQLEQEEDELIRISNDLIQQIKKMQKKGTKYAGGSMTWPTPSSGSISSSYGMRLHPILKKYRMHTGIDINASSGASIVAANRGTVVLAGWQSGYGYTVIVDHGGGISTLYAHCSRLLVSVGESVEAGGLIAKVGSTGLSTGPHLHFEVRKDGETTDPLGYVSP